MPTYWILRIYRPWGLQLLLRAISIKSPRSEDSKEQIYVRYEESANWYYWYCIDTRWDGTLEAEKLGRLWPWDERML